MKQKKIVGGSHIYECLIEHGIVPLTGEADGLSMRILCDLTPDGVALLDSFFGGAQFTSEGWNRGIKSVMLSHEVMREIIPFALFWEGASVVAKLTSKSGGDVIYISYEGEYDPDYFNSYRDIHHVRLYFNNSTAGDFRNRHEFSGRVR